MTPDVKKVLAGLGAGLVIGVGGTLATVQSLTVEIVRMPRKGDVFTGPVKSVHDGDTPTLDHHGQDLPIRIWGIEAPEINQTCELNQRKLDCGKQSRDALESLTKNFTLQCTYKSLSYERLVSTCIMNDGRDVAEEMLRRGQAFADDKYARGDLQKRYKAIEAEAKEKGVGIWAPGYKIERPEHWRACKKKNHPEDCLKP